MRDTAVAPPAARGPGSAAPDGSPAQARRPLFCQLSVTCPAAEQPRVTARRCCHHCPQSRSSRPLAPLPARGGAHHGDGDGDGSDQPASACGRDVTPREAAPWQPKPRPRARPSDWGPSAASAPPAAGSGSWERWRMWLPWGPQQAALLSAPVMFLGAPPPLPRGGPVRQGAWGGRPCGNRAGA